MRLCHRGLDVAGYFAEAGRLVADAAPYDGCCWFTLDPATFLPTCHIGENSIRDEDVPLLARNEYEEDDINKFSELAKRRPAAGILSLVTRGRRDRSPRYRTILRPNGFEDELRAAFVEEGVGRGGAAFYRHQDAPDFVEREAVFLATVGPLLAEGLRRAILISSVAIEPAPDAPGLILLNEGYGVETMTPAAEHWLADLSASPAQDAAALPDIIYAVASRASRIGSGGMPGGSELARARVRTASGRWLVLHGSLLDDGRAAIILEPARPPEIAPLIVDAYGLSERNVTQLVLQGLSTAEIAGTLFLSPYTVQDHLKAIFDKVDVRSRRQLVATIFFEHYAPRMGAGDNLASGGWFAE